MRRLELIIDEVRKQTENEDFTDTTGISDNEFVQYANDAQERLHSKIRQTFPRHFVKEGFVDSANGVEAYDFPADIYLEHAIENMEFSPNGVSTQYYPIKKGSIKERNSVVLGNPDIYIPRAGHFLASPIPDTSTGIFRFDYVYRLASLDKRRGKISAVTLNSVAKTITSLTLDTTETIDATDLTDADYMCVVSRFGIIKMQGIIVNAVDAGTGVVTVDSSFIYQTNETAAAGDYVVTGKYATTHAQLPETCERYLISYMSWKVFRRDSNADSAEQNQELKELEDEIVTTFASVGADDVLYPPILDSSYAVYIDET